MPIFNYEEGKAMSQFPEGKYMFESSTQGMHDTEQTVKDNSLSFGPPDIENTFTSISLSLIISDNDIA